MAMSDILRGDEGQARSKLTKGLMGAIQKKTFGAIIVDYDWLKIDIERYYYKKGSVFDTDTDTVFWPVTGNRTRPEFVYLPKE